MQAAKVFEFLGFIQVVSSIIYLIITKSYGTPLKDSLTAAQLKLRLESVRKRRRAFYVGLAGAVAAFLLAKHQKLF